MNLLLHTLLLYFQFTTIYSIEYYNIVLPFNGVHNATYFIQEGLDVELFCGEDQQYSGDTKYFINNILIDKNSSNIEITNKTLRIYNIGIQQKASYSCKSALILPILPNSNEFYIWSIPLKISPISANISLSLSSSYISPVFGGMSRLVAEIKDTTYVEFFNIYWKTSINIPQITQENMKIFENNLEQTLLLVLSHGIIHIYWARFPFLIWANLDITETLESNRVQVSPIFENETCSVIYSPPDMTIYEGDSTTFECVTNLTPENIKWLHDGELILYDFNKIKIGNSALKINHVKRENIGKYTCVISCEGIELTSSSFLEINESYPLNSTGGGNTDIDITLINLTNFMLKTGESFSFQLNAPNFCASKAYRNGEVFVISDTSGSTLVSLNITNVTRNDTGLYQLMIFCGESVLSYTIPIIVEDKFETDQNLIEITRDDFSDYHTIQWSLPYFLSTVSLYQCLEIKSIKGFEDYTCFNNSLIPKMAVNRSLPYNHTFYMTLFIIDHDFNSHNISSMSYYVEIPAYNISMDDVTIYDVVWKIKDKKWVINWTLNNSIETEDVSYDVSCKKYNGDTVGKGVISHPPFTCGKIGIGVSMIDILVYYKKVEAKKYYFRNRFPSPNFLNTKWNLDRNNMQLLFINDRHNFIDSHLPILLRLQKLECINICNVQHEWVYQTSKILHEIRNLNFSSIYRLYYMRSDIEDFDTNSYIYFYTSPQEASKNVGSWFFLLSILFMLLFVILFLLLHKYILSKPNTLRKIEVVENWDDPYDYIFNVNFLPLDIANFGSVDLYLSRNLNEGFGVLVNSHNERCILKILTNLPNISFKTKLLQRCDNLKYSYPEYVTKKNRFGYNSFVSTHEIRIGSHDYYPSEIEAEQSAARNALIELKEIEKSTNVLLPEYLFRILMPESELFCSYRNTLHLLCFDIGCDLPEYKTRNTISGCELQIKIGNDFAFEKIYPSQNISVCLENLCFDTLMKLQVLSTNSVFNESLINYSQENLYKEKQYFQSLSNYLSMRRWIYVRLKLDQTVQGDGVGHIQICKRQFILNIPRPNWPFAKEKLACRTLDYLGLIQNLTENKLKF